MQKARFGGIVIIALIAGCVIVFGRKPVAIVVQPTAADVESTPLVLRRPVALSVGDQLRGPTSPPPSSTDTVPIQWDAPRNALPAPVPTHEVLRAPAAVRGSVSPPPLRRPSVPELRPKPADQYHRIVDGETLRDISARYFGTPDRYMELFRANRGVLPHPDVLPLGARIVIPTTEEGHMQRLPKLDR